MWSEFVDDTPVQAADEEDVKADAVKAFASATKTLWDSGVGGVLTDTWAALGAGWKKGEILDLFSVDGLGLSRIEQARVIVLIDDLQSQFQDLATASLSLQEAFIA